MGDPCRIVYFYQKNMTIIIIKGRRFCFYYGTTRVCVTLTLRLTNASLDHDNISFDIISSLHPFVSRAVI